MTVSTCVSAAKNGRILIVGATGFIGRFVAEASLDAGQPTYVLIRPGPLDPSKADIIKSLKDRGAIILHVCVCVCVNKYRCLCFPLFLLSGVEFFLLIL